MSVDGEIVLLLLPEREFVEFQTNLAQKDKNLFINYFYLFLYVFNCFTFDRAISIFCDLLDNLFHHYSFRSN